MSANNAKQLNPAALAPEDAARMLGISIDMLRADIAAGALTNADGTVNLVHYAAWLNAAPPPVLVDMEDVDGED